MRKKKGKGFTAIIAAFILGMIVIPMPVYAAEVQGSAKAVGEVTDVTAGWNGFHKSPDSEEWFYYKNGKVQSGLNDVIKGTVNGTYAWWHVVKGKVTFDDTIAKNSKGWWYIKDGKVDFNYNGLASNANGTYKLTKGKVTFKDNGVTKIGRSWYNLSKSRLVAGPTVAKNSKGWWYIDKTGKVDFGYNGFAKNKNGWWYCKGGKVQFKTNSVIKGKVDGQNAWWHVVKGKVTFDNTVAKNSKGWWHIQKGKVNFNSNTVAKNSKGWWCIRNGKVDFSYNGFASNKNGVWYIRNGKVDFAASAKLKHTHKWKAHKATKQVWVPKVVTVVDQPEHYEEYTLYRMYWYNTGKWEETRDPSRFNAWSKDRVGGQLSPNSIYMANKPEDCPLFTGYDESGNPSYTNDHAIISELYDTIPAVTHKEDQGYYKKQSYTDYYYCSCGARK